MKGYSLISVMIAMIILMLVLLPLLGLQGRLFETVVNSDISGLIQLIEPDLENLRNSELTPRNATIGTGNLIIKRIVVRKSKNMYLLTYEFTRRIGPSFRFKTYLFKTRR